MGLEGVDPVLGAYPQQVFESFRASGCARLKDRVSVLVAGRCDSPQVSTCCLEVRVAISFGCAKKSKHVGNEEGPRTERP